MILVGIIEGNDRADATFRYLGAAGVLEGQAMVQVVVRYRNNRHCGTELKR